MLILITAGYLVAGMLIGLLAGMLGIGGGLIAIPIMTLVLGMSQKLAQGTAFILILPTILVAVYKYNKNLHIDWHVAATGAATAVFFSSMGANLALKADPFTLRCNFALFLLAIVLFYSRQTYKMHAVRMAAVCQGHARELPKFSPIISAFVGGAAGLLGGYFGVGGTILVVPLMTTYFKYTHINAQALALTMVIPSSTIALAAYSWAGQVDWTVGAPLAFGSVLCVSQGVRLALCLPERFLRGCFVSVVFSTILLIFTKDLPL